MSAMLSMMGCLDFFVDLGGSAGVADLGGGVLYSSGGGGEGGIPADSTPSNPIGGVVDWVGCPMTEVPIGGGPSIEAAT